MKMLSYKRLRETMLSGSGGPELYKNGEYGARLPQKFPFWSFSLAIAVFAFQLQALTLLRQETQVNVRETGSLLMLSTHVQHFNIDAMKLIQLRVLTNLVMLFVVKVWCKPLLRTEREIERNGEARVYYLVTLKEQVIREGRLIFLDKLRVLMYVGGALLTIILSYRHSFVNITSKLTFSMSIFAIGVEYVLTGSVLDYVGRSRSDVDLEVHAHQLYYDTHTPTWQRCSRCCKSFGEAPSSALSFRCTVCDDFLLCEGCFNGDTPNSAESVLEVLNGVENTKWSYVVDFLKALTLVKVLWLWYVISFVALTCVAACRLAVDYSEATAVLALAESNEQLFASSCASLGFFIIMRGIAGKIQRFSVHLVSMQVQLSIRSKLLQTILAHEVSFFEATRTRDLSRVFGSDLSNVFNNVKDSVNVLLRHVVELLSGVVMCFIISWRLSLVSAVVLAPLVYLDAVDGLLRNKAFAQQNKLHKEAVDVGYDALNYFRVVKTFNTESSEVARMQHRLELWSEEWTVIWGRQAMSDLLIGVLPSLLDVFLRFLGGLVILASPNELTVHSLMLLLGFSRQVHGSLELIISTKDEYHRTAISARRLFAMLETATSTPSCEEKMVLRGPGTIEMKDVSFAFDSSEQGVFALRNVNFTVQAGTTVALVGSSGAGKSTILDLIMRFYSLAPPNPQDKKGAILINGIDVQIIRTKTLRRYIGYVSQETELFEATILANITYGLEMDEYTMEDVNNAVKQAAAHDFILALPNGYSTRIGDNGIRLSGGQRQRLSLARCFLRKPAVLLLDEPTAALDSVNEAMVQAGIEEISRRYKCTVIVAAHRLSTIKNADKIIVLSAGEVVGQGTHSDLMKGNEEYVNLVQGQV